MTRRGLAIALSAVLAATLPACSLVGGGDTYTLTAYFDRAVSVFPTADVRVLGLPAGSVSKVVVDGDRVRIDMEIPSDIAIPDDAIAQIVPQSLIGERYVQISPAFQDGMTAAEDGDVIEKTIIPVEPDEALAALKEFLDTLDPDGIGDLVSNLDEDLRGNGAALNDALGSLSELVDTFAEKDDVLLRIVDSFDRLNATLVTREQQLGEVLDAFAEASQVLANERESIEALVSGLADLSRNGLALIGEHSTALRADIATLAEAAATIEANLTAVSQLVEAGPDLTAGLIGAYNPELRAFNLRNSFSPLTTELVSLLGPAFCLPVLQDCPVSGVSAGVATPATLSSGASPITSLLALLQAPSSPAPPSEESLASRFGGFLRDAASTLVGAGG